MQKNKPLLSLIVTIDFKDKVDEFLRPFLDPEIGKQGYEIIVVEDVGFRYPFVKKKEQFVMPGGAEVTILRFRRAGRAKKRNYALALSRSDLVLLFAGDFVPTKETFTSHLSFHERHPGLKQVAVGPAVFVKEDKTPFMHWLEDLGSLFGVPFLTYTKEEPLDFFYGANTSIKKDFLTLAGPFDEAFLYDSCEDYDMGQRLKKIGMESFILPAATVIHEHQVTLPQRLSAVELAGESTIRLDEKFPDEISWIGERSVSIKEIEKEMKEALRKYKKSNELESLYTYYALSSRAAFCKGYQKALKKAGIIAKG